MRFLPTLFMLVTAVAAQDTLRPRHNASYVPDDDATIRGLVAQTTEAAKNGNFDAAAEGLQTLLLGKDGVVVAVRGRELYTSPRRWAMLQLLSERPPFTKEVLAAWRSVHDTSANAAISAAIESGDARAVARLVARYPAATSAPAALLALADQALQQGDPESARAYLMRAQEHVPRSVKAKWLLSPAFVARQRHLADVAPRRPEAWPTLGGDATRARNGDPLPSAQLTKLWDAPLLDRKPSTFEFRSALGMHEHSPILPFYPVFDGKHVYVHVGPKVAVLSRRTGKLLYYAPSGTGVNTNRVDNMIAASPGLRAATVANGVLYFNRVLYNGRGLNARLLRHNSLVAFDTQRRTILWEIRKGGRKPEALRKNLFFRGAPAVVRGKLYVYAAVREESEGKPSRKEEAYLYCFEARTGELLWHRFLGYGDTEAAPVLPPQSGLPPAVAFGVVVAVSGLGVAAALNAETGEVLWLLRYDRKPVRERERLTEMTERQVYPGSGWFREAPRIVGDMVFLAPIDSDQRYGCWLRGQQDAEDGEFYLQQWAVARNANPGRNSLLEQVAGVHGDRIYFVGRRDERAGELETYQTVVSNPVRRGDDSFAYARIPAIERDKNGLRVPPEVFGRGMIAGTTLLIPTRQVLFRFDVGKAPSTKIRANERFQEIPPLTPFAPDPEKTPAGRPPRPLFGTLVSVGGRLYAVTAQRVICYGPRK